MLAPSAEDIRLFVRLIRRDHQEAERCLAVRRAPIDLLVDTAAAHGLSVALGNALDGSPLRASFSAPRLEALGRRCERQLERSRRLLAALPGLAGRLAEASQPFLLLKGPYLASRYFGDPLAREYVDIDIVVRRRDRERAFELLAGMGYELRSGVLLNTRLTCFFVHGFDFAGPAGKVDLHWCLARQASLRIDEDRVWRSRQAWTIESRPYDVLSDEDEIAFAALSLVRDLERGRPKAKNIVDLVQIAAALADRLDWDALFERSRAEGCHGLLVNVLALGLEVAAAEDLCPRLVEVLARNADRRVPVPAGEPSLRFAPMRLALGNKLWAARAHDAPVAAWFLWWAASLPFRLASFR